MDNDALEALWTEQLRKKVEAQFAFVEENHARYNQRMVEKGLALPLAPGEAAEYARQFREAQVVERVPFALTLGHESNTKGPLSEEQLHRAAMLTIQQRTKNTLEQFGERLQNAPATMAPRRRQFAEAFLAMAKRHNALMDERFIKTEETTEADLADVANQIADDLTTLTRTLPSSNGDDDKPTV